MQEYKKTGLVVYKDTGIQGYRDTEYRDTGIQ